MMVRDLRTGLQSLAATLSTWRAKDAAADLARLIEALSEYDDMTVVGLCALLGKARDKETGASKEKNPNKRIAVDSSVVDEYLSALRNANDDVQEFGRVLSRLKSDRKARLPEAAQVAMRFIGADNAYASKAAAIQAIKRKQESADTLQQRLGRSGEIF